MKRLLLLCILFNAIPIFILGQVEAYQWNDTTDYSIDKSFYTDYGAVILLDHRIQEFAGDLPQELGRKTMRHKIIKFLEAGSIRAYSNIYIEDVENLLSFEARIIKPTGLIIEVEEDMIFKRKDLYDDYITIFEIDGIEENDVLEYVYKMKNVRDLFGIEIFQEDIPTKKAIFEIQQTMMYEILAQRYNGLDTFKIEAVEDAEIVKAVSITENIPALPYEDYAAQNQERMSASYSVTFLKIGWLTEDIMNWDILMDYYAWLDDEVRVKGAKRLFEELEIDKETTELEKIIRLERHFKEKMTYQNELLTEQEYRNILKNQSGTDIDFTRAMKYLLDLQGIESIWLLSSNRLNFSLDPGLPSPYGLVEHVLYVPTQGKFLSMNYPNMRFGAPPSQVLDNYALVLDDDEKTDPIGKIQFNASNYTKMNIEMDLNISPSFGKVNIQKKSKYTGYVAAGMRELVNNSDKETYRNVFENYEGKDLGTVDLRSLSIKNQGASFGIKNTPLEFEMDMDAFDLLAIKDTSIRLKLGKLIGEMNDLYDVQDRKTSITIDYPYAYICKINLKIPEGYIVKGLVDFVKKEELFDDKGTKVAAFESAVKKKDNLIKLTIYEYYLNVFYPKEKYKDFRNIINAGADFSQLELILEKE